MAENVDNNNALAGIMQAREVESSASTPVLNGFCDDPGLNAEVSFLNTNFFIYLTW